MGTARTSPKVVRERRAKGIRSNRGKVRRHFPKAHRNDRSLEVVARDAKAWVPAPDPLQAEADRLIVLADPPPSVRDDVTQEVWVQLLEGRTSDHIAAELRRIIATATDIAFGPWGSVSLDAPLFPGADAPRRLDFLDDTGRINRKARHRPSRIRRLSRCVCGSWTRTAQPSTGRCQRCHWKEGRKGATHSVETREQMGATRRSLWAGDYGDRRRAALKVEQMICRKCGFDGPLEDFARNPHAYQGRDKVCKPCMAAYTREWKQRRKQLAAAA